MAEESSSHDRSCVASGSRSVSPDADGESQVLRSEADKNDFSFVVEGDESRNAESFMSGSSAAVFQSLLGEPYETIFANPPADLVRASSVEMMKADRSEKKKEDETFMLLTNLDTKETVRLDSINESFCGDWLDPSQLAQGSAWDGWWREKRDQDERLWVAAEGGDIMALKAALAQKTGRPMAEVNSRSPKDGGRTALHMASAAGHVEAVRVLINAGADVTSETDDRDLPIHLASAKSHVDVIKALLESECEEQIVFRNSLGQRPAEVSTDIRTAEVFRQYDATLSSSPSSPRSPELAGANTWDSKADDYRPDEYASRTPLQQGHVLLHNSRADHVYRLLHPAKGIPPSSLDMSPISSDQGKGARLLGRVNGDEARKGRFVHAPFVAVRDIPTIENVGPESFKLEKLLGGGAFGQVYQVAHHRTGQQYAMKCLQKKQIIGKNLLRYAMTERNVLSFVRHPYIVSLHYAFQTPNLLVLVLQLCPGGNLKDLLAREHRLQEPVAKLYTAEILLALEHLHMRNIVFRDLKPDNVVIDEQAHVMLTDFGLSKEGVRDPRGAKSFCGSMAYFAPEILSRGGHGTPVDIYGLGVMLYEMLTSLPPFFSRDRKTLLDNIEFAHLNIPPYVKWEANSLIRDLMARVPSRRLGASNTALIRQHVFFRGLDFEALMRREVDPPKFNSVATPRHRRTAAPPNPFSDPRSLRSGRHHDVPHWEFSTPEPASALSAR